MSLDGFIGSQGSTIYQKYDVKDVAVEGDTAYVTVEYVYKLGIRVPNLDPEPLTTTTEQEWVKVDGSWYFKCPDDPFKAAREIASGRRKKAGAGKTSGEATPVAPADTESKSEPPK